MFNRGSKKEDARERLADLEKRFNVKGLEKRLANFEGRELDKVLDKLDLKELEKKLEKDVARRYQGLRHFGHQEEKASSAGFIAGLFIGVMVGVVLAIVFGKQNEQSPMDRFASDTGAGGASPRGEGSTPEVRAESGGPIAGTFGDSVAIEREIDGDDDLVVTTTDSVDVGSDDVRRTADDVSAHLNRPPDDR